MPIREVIAANLAALMAASRETKTIVAVQEATARHGNQVGKSTIDRVLKGTTALNIDNLETIAKVFGLDPWQLLVPAMQPKNPPVLKSVGEAEDKLYRRIEALASEIVELKKAPQ